MFKRSPTPFQREVTAQQRLRRMGGLFGGEIPRRAGAEKGSKTTATPLRVGGWVCSTSTDMVLEGE